MSPTRLWILIIIALFVVSVLVGFAPIRHLHTAAEAPAHTFTYTFTEPLVEDPADLDAKAEEIRALLISGGMAEDDIEYVQFLNDDPTRLEVETYATRYEESERFFSTITQALRAEYPDVAGSMPGGPTERPVAKLGNFLGIYPLKPQVRLGLDLQGGAHVVLQCLPETVMIFESDEDKPMAEFAPAEEAESEEAAGWQPKHTKESLARSVQAELLRRGASEKGLKVQVVAPYRIRVVTRAENDQEVKRQKSAVQKLLADTYPDLTIKAEVASSIFVKGGAFGERTADKVLNIISRRLYEMSEIREPITQVQGNDRIIVELPGVKNPEDVKRILQATAILKFVLIPARYEDTSPGDDLYDEWRDKQTSEIVSWERVLSESITEFAGSDLKSTAAVHPGRQNDWAVGFELRDDKKQEFAEFTRRNVGRFMAIVLDDQCQMAPVIREEIAHGRGEISGNMSLDEARELKLLLNAGALPVPLEIVEDRTVSATLGQDSIRQSLRAGLLGLVVIAIFMIAYYRLPGVLANIALLLYVLMLLALIAAPNVLKVFAGVGSVTLTLPGIAGIILSIGMAVDANVIIFERLKEELWAGKSMRAAVEEGFSRAWTAILDGNVTTLITAAVLYFLGTSLIKSFAVTLFLGVTLSLFTAVTVTRWLVTIVGQTRLGERLSLYGIDEKDVRG